MNIGILGYSLGHKLGVMRRDMSTPFAIYSADDNSLTFYKNKNYKSLRASYDSGETVNYNGKVVTDFYTGFENTEYDGSTTYPPWYDIKDDIWTVEFEDRIMPVSMRCWFMDHSNITQIDLSNIDGRRLKTMRSAFNRCTSLTTINLTGLNTSKVTTMAHMLRETAISTVDLSSLDCSSLEDVSYMFRACNNITDFNFLSSFKCDNAKNFEGMCRDCTGVAGISLTINTHNAESLKGIFYGCSNLKTAKLNADARKVKNFMYLFGYCSSLTSLDLSGCIGRAADNMERICDECTALTSIDLSGLSGSKPSNVSCMFRVCSSLPRVDLTPIDFSNVIDSGWMFFGCSSLITVYVRDNTDMSGVETHKRMFASCSKLMGGNGTMFDSLIEDGAYARIDTSSTKGYFAAKRMRNYGGIDLPDIEAVWPDRSNYKYYTICREDDGTIYVTFTTRPLVYQYINVDQSKEPDIPDGYYPSIKTVTSESTSINWYNVCLTNGRWKNQYFNTASWSSSQYSYHHLYYTDFYWANHTIENESGTTWKTYEAPVNIPVLSYNGRILPELPEWDRTVYPYACIIRSSDGTTSLYCTPIPFRYGTYTSASTGKITTNIHIPIDPGTIMSVIRVRLKNDLWSTLDTITWGNSESTDTLYRYLIAELLWTEYDVMNVDTNEVYIHTTIPESLAD